MKNLQERVLALLQRPPCRYKFKHIVRKLHVRPQEVEVAIAELRKSHPNLVFAKFDRTFYLSPTPTPFSNQTDLSRIIPIEGALGILSDTHLCSNAERLDLINKAYDTYQDQGIRVVLHCGDLMDGQDVYRGHNFNIKVFGGYAQARYFIQKYPVREGITTYAISGNHDCASYLKTGMDQASLIANGFQYDGRTYQGRKDIVYLGQYSHRIILPQQVSIQLLHPIGNNSYAKSYKQQKRSESMDRNLRPDLQLSGHFHDFNYSWMNHTHFIALPGLQDETEFFTRLGLPRCMGFGILHYRIKEGKFASLSPEMFMYA